MATTTDLTPAVGATPLADPTAILDAREAVALRNMYALIALAEGGKDERARVAAAVELNKMLSVGMVNKGVLKATQVNNFQVPPTPGDESTQRLATRLRATTPPSVVDDIEDDD